MGIEVSKEGHEGVHSMSSFLPGTDARKSETELGFSLGTLMMIQLLGHVVVMLVLGIPWLHLVIPRKNKVDGARNQAGAFRVLVFRYNPGVSAKQPTNIVRTHWGQC